MPQQFALGHRPGRVGSRADWNDGGKYFEVHVHGGGVSKVDKEDIHHALGRSWSRSSSGHAASRRSTGTDYLHRLILNPPEGMEVDHINRDPLDNRRENLRICTSSQNKMNQVTHGDSLSRFKGVSWDKGRARWRAQIKSGDDKIFIGRYDDELEAAKAYDDESVRLHGDFALLNFPREEVPSGEE